MFLTIFLNAKTGECKGKSFTPVSMIFWKWTATEQLLTFLCFSLLWIKTLIFLERILLARYPNTNNIESMTLDFPLPFGPMMAVKFWKRKWGYLYKRQNQAGTDTTTPHYLMGRGPKKSIKLRISLSFVLTQFFFSISLLLDNIF